MPLNFAKIFQDSWNFILNQRQIMTFFMLFFTINYVVSQLYPLSVSVVNEQLQVDGLLSAFVLQLIQTLFQLWLLNLIIQINRADKLNFSTALSASVFKLAPFLILSFIVLLPFSFMLTTVAQQAGPLSLLSGLFTGYLFIRTFLAPYFYIIEKTSFFNSIKLAWLNSAKRLFPLFLLALLNYILPIILTHLFGQLGHSAINMVLQALILAALNIFVLIFTYRFYQLFVNRNLLRNI